MHSFAIEKVHGFGSDCCEANAFPTDGAVPVAPSKPGSMAGQSPQDNRCLNQCWHNPQQRQCGSRCLVACWQPEASAN